MIAVFATLKREFLIAGRSSFESFTPVAFFVLASVVFALGLGSSTEVLQQVAPMAIWIIALLASLLSLEGLYKRDFDDGTLAIALIHSNSNPFVTLVRLLVHWSLVGTARHRAYARDHVRLFVGSVGNADTDASVC